MLGRDGKKHLQEGPHTGSKVDDWPRPTGKPFPHEVHLASDATMLLRGVHSLHGPVPGLLSLAIPSL